MKASVIGVRQQGFSMPVLSAEQEECPAPRREFIGKFVDMRTH
jgi:hypothetical protein